MHFFRKGLSLMTVEKEVSKKGRKIGTEQGSKKEKDYF